MHKRTEDRISGSNSRHLKNKKTMKMKSKTLRKTGETWNDKLKKRDDIFWRYYRNKRLNELFREELDKKNPILTRRFQIKPREREADEEYEIRKNLVKNHLKQS